MVFMSMFEGNKLCVCVCVCAGYESATAPPSGPAWQGRSIGTTKLRLVEFSSFLEHQRDPDSVCHTHTHIHIYLNTYTHTQNTVTHRTPSHTEHRHTHLHTQNTFTHRTPSHTPSHTEHLHTPLHTNTHT